MEAATTNIQTELGRS